MHNHPVPHLRPWPPAERSPALDLVVDLHRDGDPLSREALLPHLAEDVVITPPPLLASVFKPYFGVAGVLAWIEERERSWPDLRVTPESYAAAGDHVVVLGRLDAGSVRAESTWMWSVRDGRVGAVRAFRYPSEALVRLAALAPG